MPRTFYRIIKGDLATEDDFVSNFARGRAPRHSERINPEEHRSISAFARLEEALAMQATYPRLGRSVAELELADEDVAIDAQKSSDDPVDSHYNLQGEPAEFLARVRRVIPIPPPADLKS